MVTMNKSYYQSGNVLFIILIAVVLFAALSYAVTQSTRGGGGDVTKEKAALSAAGLMQYATEMQAAILRMKIRGVADTDFCFDTNVIDEPKWYDGAPGCSDDRNKVFHPDGGGVSARLIDERYLDLSEKATAIANPIHQYGIPVISGRHQVAYIGNNVTPDLVFLAFYLDEAVCTAINEKIGIPPPIIRDYTCCGVDVAKQFNGSYGGQDPIGANDDVTDTSRHNKFAGSPFGCVRETSSGVHYYYHTLIER
jgi:hypothetical protein